ncbi:MAG: cytochrome c maturation protein CcmE [Zetaproteobacteria bacterium]|nr:cytochrome c maturation protein CcmE [Zetaproteobacteria bacterium]
MHKKTKLLAGGIIIIATILLMSVLSLQQNTVYFYTPSEAMAQKSSLSHKKIKIGGIIQKGSVDWQAPALSLRFVVTDTEDTHIPIEHTGTPPDMFKEGQGVVVDGRFNTDGSTFMAETLMVKHSEEYQIPSEGKSMNTDLLKKSILEKE